MGLWAQYTVLSQSSPEVWDKLTPRERRGTILMGGLAAAFTGLFLHGGDMMLPKLWAWMLAAGVAGSSLVEVLRRLVVGRLGGGT